MRMGLVGLLSAGFVLPVAAGTIVVHPGSSIQAAVKAASPGDRILVLPGTYREGSDSDLNAITVTQNDLKIVGLSSRKHPVVLQNAGGQSFGIWVSPLDSTGAGAQADAEHPPCGPGGATVKGFSLSGFTIRGFTQHGVHLACVDGFEISNNVADGNSVYGIFPVVSQNGVVSGNVVTNTSDDAAIYVGQSDRVRILGNSASNSLIGIEVENSRHVVVMGNRTFDNTIGIIVDLLPGLLKTTQQSTALLFNEVRDNNRPNNGQPGDIIGAIPAGTGILLVGADTTTVAGNEVAGNGFTGIGVASLCTGLALLGQGCDGLGIDPNPDSNFVVANELVGNGTVPNPVPFLDALRADLVWDGSGTGNCWSLNHFSTSFPSVLPSCP